MARKIRYRQLRLYNIKIFIVCVLFVIVLIGGLLAVDFSKSYIFYGQNRLEIFEIDTVGNDIYQISILNSRFDLNLKYLVKNIDNVKDLFR